MDPSIVVALIAVLGTVFTASKTFKNGKQVKTLEELLQKELAECKRDRKRLTDLLAQTR